MESALLELKTRIKSKEVRVVPVSKRINVIPFIAVISYLPILKRVFRLHFSTLELFLFIVDRCFARNVGCSVHYLCMRLYGDASSSNYRSVHYRLVTLTSKGFVRTDRKKGLLVYYLTDKAKGMLLEVENEVNK